MSEWVNATWNSDSESFPVFFLEDGSCIDVDNLAWEEDETVIYDWLQTHTRELSRKSYWVDPLTIYSGTAEILLDDDPEHEIFAPKKVGQ